MFTPRHAQKIANVIRSAKSKHNSNVAPLVSLQAEFAKIFADENPEISLGEFERGCSIMPVEESRKKVA